MTDPDEWPPFEPRPDSIAIVDWEEGGAGQVHSWIHETGLHVACFVNAADDAPEVDIEAARKAREAKVFDYPTRVSFKGLPLLSAREWPQMLLDHGIKRALVMPSDRPWRLANIRAAEAAGIELVSAIHPSVTVMPDAILHQNLILHARSYVGYRAELYPGVVLNTGAQIDHHNVLYECVRIDPGVVTAGNVTIERFAVIHTGAKIINKMRIGENATVGAGAVIIRDVPPNTTVVGVPGRVIGEHEAVVMD